MSTAARPSAASAARRKARRAAAREADRRIATPPQYARELGIDTDKVHGWIRSGELRAINIAANPRGRPRWVIDRADIVDFERRRAATPPEPVSRRRPIAKPVREYV